MKMNILVKEKIKAMLSLHREAIIKLEAMDVEISESSSPQRDIALSKLAVQYDEIAEQIVAAGTKVPNVREVLCGEVPPTLFDRNQLNLIEL